MASSIWTFYPAPFATAQPTIAGCPVLPADNIWNVPVDTLPLDAQSNTYVASIGSTSRAHADFGSGLWNGGPIGIPFIVVPASQPRVPVTFDYDDESDPGPYPIPPNAPIEGGPSSTGDRHILVLESGSCTLYETYDSHPAGGGWHAGSGAVFNLRSHALRPQTWTSADAAGLPILPGLVRYDEVASGEITHAIRFTAPRTRNSYVWPARHQAGQPNSSLPPMGQRFRLKAQFDVSPYAPEVQVILRAMQKYGMILADNGSAWYVSGAPDERWDNDALAQLGQLRGSDFEAVDVSSLQISADSGQARVTIPEPPIESDYDGDGKSDLIVFRPPSGMWFILTSSSGFDFASHVQYQLGLPGDRPLTGDFDGDRRSDLVVWRPPTGEWFFRLSGNNYMSISSIQWGLPTDQPIVGDYDGDGRDDLTVYRPSSGTFFTLRSSGGYDRSRALAGSPQHLLTAQNGGAGWTAVRGDFDGDNRTNFIAVFWWERFWNLLDSSAQLVWSRPWGMPGDTPQGCDWDGNGIADRVVTRPTSTGELLWFTAADSGPVYTLNFGRNHHIPRCDHDFNGDEQIDQSVFDPTSGWWLLRDGNTGEITPRQFGLPGDIPL